ncbi:hypothetical protein [Streptomyces sp. S.PB5]|uniref:hypothetical protein n=1 Tax=Streptomyces sp. S.PB5 TaxID=3020844 RepID=UPI0025AFF63A|nr:hypothetical protein [Streptomyces sp. S.PB5]MDN3028629.1 hypothetical protein [Streptomyces sp. S.PB5]
MTTTSPSSFAPARPRRLAAAVSMLTVIAAAAAVITLVVGASLPESWWPRTGAAFAADTASSASPRHDPCVLIAGPAKEYCARGASTSASRSAPASAERDLAGAAWRLLPAGAGLTALVIWRRRSTTARERA